MHMTKHPRPGIGMIGYVDGKGKGLWTNLGLI
jgi:hypothetical protein